MPDNEIVKIDPDAVYSDKAVAALFGITDRQLRRWRNKRVRVGRVDRLWFPRPFARGGTPCWTGQTLIAWQEQQQAAVLV
jgi:hypothetical protein